MRPGEWFADRFEIVAEAGRGAAGTVYRARDRFGAQVALKVFAPRIGSDLDRFQREATLLSTIRHEHIVAYVAHGVTSGRRHWIALEWLDGETLETRLKRGPLPVPIALGVGRALARALVCLHERGIVHRDIKPANIVLGDGGGSPTKLLDLGVVHLQRAAMRLTDQSAVVGTPGYLSPEQARGEDEIDGRADVFALGAVLYECLSGKKAFHRPDLVSSLLATVFDEPDPLPKTPGLAAANNLIATMLVKDRPNRPNAERVEAALTRLCANTRTDPVRGGASSGVGSRERVFLSIVLARIPPGASESAAERAERDIARLGAKLEHLSDGTLFVGSQEAHSPTEAAIRAARAALVLAAWLGGAAIAVVSARSDDRAADTSVGRAIERGASILRAAGEHARPLVDATTASLLEARFPLRPTTDGLAELMQREPQSPAFSATAGAGRPVLGRVPPFVGRETEVAELVADAASCIESGGSRTVLLTGAPGSGKSRLVAELIKRLADIHPDVRTYVARADPCAAGAPLGLLQQLLEVELPVDRQTPIAARRDHLVDTARAWGAASPATLAAFWGEILGVRFDDVASAALAQARRDAGRMANEMVNALAAWLDRAGRTGLTTIVLDDLQWGDYGSVKLLDLALRRANGAFLVVALGRSDVEGALPELSELSHIVRRELAPLPRDACIEMLKACADDISTERAERLFLQSAGNPFYLEELLRALAGGGADQAPDAILALVEDRLRALPPESRRVLRAASILGRTFSLEGVRYVCGGDVRAEHAALACTALVEREILVAGPTGGEFAFAHDFFREASYGMLPDHDRVSGHRLAGEWLALSQTGEPSTLAGHFERAGLLDHAARRYVDAARRALEANAFGSALAFVDRARRCGAGGDLLGVASLIAAQAHRWRGEHARASEDGAVALARLPAEGPAFFSALAEVAAARGRLGQMDGLADAYRVFRDAPRPPPGTAAASQRSIAATFLALHLLTCGQPDLALAIVDEVEAEAPASMELEVRARVAQVRAFRALFRGDLGAYLLGMEAAVAAFESAGDTREACVQRVNVGNACVQLGAFRRAEDALDRTLAEASRMGLENVVGYAKQNLAIARARLGQLEDGWRLIQEAIALFQSQGDRRMVGTSRVYASLIRADMGAVYDAVLAAEQATIDLEVATSAQACAFAALALVRAALARSLPGDGRPALIESVAGAAKDARRILDELDGIEEGEGLVHLAEVEALLLAGDDRAADAARLAVARLERLAERIADPSLRASFLENVPEHRRLRAIVGQLVSVQV